MKQYLKLLSFGQRLSLLGILMARLSKSFFELLAIALLIPLLRDEKTERFLGAEQWLAQLDKSILCWFFLGCSLTYVLMRFVAYDKRVRLQANLLEVLRKNVLQRSLGFASKDLKEISTMNLNHHFVQETRQIAKTVTSLADFVADTFTLLAYVSLLLWMLPWKVSLALMLVIVLLTLYQYFKASQTNVSLNHHNRLLNQQSQFLFNSLTSWGNSLKRHYLTEHLQTTIAQNSQLEYEIGRRRESSSLFYEAAGLICITALLNYQLSSGLQSIDMEAALLLLLGSFLRFAPLVFSLRRFLLEQELTLSALEFYQRLLAIPQVSQPHSQLSSIQGMSITGDLVIEDKTILANVNLHFSAGQHYAIIGPSGAGKTTLLKSLIHYDQLIILQERPAIFKGSIFDNLTLYASYRPEQIDKALTTSGFHRVLTDRRLELATMMYPEILPFSFGELQRLNLARALLQHPLWLAMDESLGNLDHQAQAQIIEGIRENYPEISTILVTHHYQILPYFSFLITITARGEIALLNNQDASLPLSQMTRFLKPWASS